MTKTPTTSEPRFPRLANQNLGGLSAVHRNPALRPALESVDDWASIVAQLRAVDAYTGPQSARIASVQDNVAALVLDELRAGRGIPDDLITKARDVKLEVEAMLAASSALEAVRAGLTNDLDAAVRDNEAALYTHLNDQLTTVTDAVRNLGDVQQIYDAESAVVADRTKDYRTLQRLADQYTSVRSGQRMLMRHVTGGEVRWQEATAIANVLEVFPQWPTWRRFGYLTDKHTGNRQTLAAPWPQHEYAGSRFDRFSQVAGTFDFLLWAATSDAELWVPTPTQLHEYEQQLEGAMAIPEAQSLMHVSPDGGGREPEYVDPASLTKAEAF